MRIRNLLQRNKRLVIAIVSIISCCTKTRNADSVDSMFPQRRDVKGRTNVIYATKLRTNKDTDEKLTDRLNEIQRFKGEKKQTRYRKNRTSDDNLNDPSKIVANKIETKYDVVSPNSAIDANLTFNATSSQSLSSSWIERVTSRIISAFTLLAISQTIINILKSDKNEIASELANRFFSKESIDVMKTVQSILSEVHTEHGVVDVFGKYRTLDVLTSIVALSRLQTAATEYEIEFTTNNLNHKDKIKDSGGDMELVNDLAHYAKYALAAYGWSLDLALRLKIHFGGNNQALFHLTGVERNDIVKAEWNTKAPHRPAYFIVRDRCKKTIVLCIRGTWSVHDMLTNLCCIPQQIDWDNISLDSIDTKFKYYFRGLVNLCSFNRRLYGHHGMLEAAKAILSDSNECIANELLEHPDYSLVLAGHSLGGGCAALLGKLLEKRYPTLRVYLYGAPCVVPENTILNKNIISVIAEGDPFSCLSLGHVADVSMGLAYLCHDSTLRYDILLRTSGCMNDHDKLWCATTMAFLRKRMTADKMYPPGRILLLRKEKSRHKQKSWLWRFGRIRARPELIEVPAHYFRDLIVSAKMFDLSKHLPSMYVSVLGDLAKYKVLEAF